ncbi:hypothetical protein RvY_14796 [Ramazzottius varieornatus]|uniref:Uncharacterized protein n=1 Tax=Ramazzottius varieornatus TaxID=947166 RepID=A0A1D1VSI2_RAMVA|nr:hypothetical protein RvY_14796 [Ramazzottius varieornatus]
MYLGLLLWAAGCYFTEVSATFVVREKPPKRSLLQILNNNAPLANQAQLLNGRYQTSHQLNPVGDGPDPVIAPDPMFNPVGDGPDPVIAPDPMFNPVGEGSEAFIAPDPMFNPVGDGPDPVIAPDPVPNPVGDGPRPVIASDYVPG